MTDEHPTNPRRAALIGLGVAGLLAIGTWFGLSRAADSGIDRLARIDALRGRCTSLWRVARTKSDTLRIDAMALPDTIDRRSNAALKQCGSLRARNSAQATPNPREMSGDPMPRGLR